MEFPALVYRCPGAHFGPSGTTYDFAGVQDDEQLREMLAQGWHESLIKAATVYAAGEDEQNEEHQYDAAPTRSELEQKASELGIKFDGRTSDRKLLEKIEEVLGGE